MIGTGEKNILKFSKIVMFGRIVKLAKYSPVKFANFVYFVLRVEK